MFGFGMQGQPGMQGQQPGMQGQSFGGMNMNPGGMQGGGIQGQYPGMQGGMGGMQGGMHGDMNGHGMQGTQGQHPGMQGGMGGMQGGMGGMQGGMSGPGAQGMGGMQPGMQGQHTGANQSSSMQGFGGMQGQQHGAMGSGMQGGMGGMQGGMGGMQGGRGMQGQQPGMQGGMGGGMQGGMGGMQGGGFGETQQQSQTAKPTAYQQIDALKSSPGTGMDRTDFAKFGPIFGQSGVDKDTKKEYINYASQRHFFTCEQLDLFSSSVYLRSSDNKKDEVEIHLLKMFWNRSGNDEAERRKYFQARLSMMANDKRDYLKRTYGFK